MSIFRSLVGVAAPIVGGFFGGPAGAAIGAQIGSAVQKRPSAPQFIPASMSSMQSSSFMPAVSAMPAMGSLPPLLGRGALGALGFGAGVAVARAGTIARAAGALCLKHPAWCANIGGTAAIIAMMESGQIPIPKRRRGRGLTPRDLRSFRRVASLVRGFCPTVRRIPSRAVHARKTGIIHA